MGIFDELKGKTEEPAPKEAENGSPGSPTQPIEGQGQVVTKGENPVKAAGDSRINMTIAAVDLKPKTTFWDKAEGTPTVKQYRIGRPRKYQDPQELLDKAAAYFESCLNDKGELIRPITITGMCNYIGTHRSALLDYEHGDCSRLMAGQGDDASFRNAIKQIKSVCEEFAENHMFTARNPAGAIFALKNYGWRDIQTIETSITEVHTIDPELRQLATDYMKQLAENQKGMVIDITPMELPDPVKAQSGGDPMVPAAMAVDNPKDNET